MTIEQRNAEDCIRWFDGDLVKLTTNLASFEKLVVEAKNRLETKSVRDLDKVAVDLAHYESLVIRIKSNIETIEGRRAASVELLK